MNIYQRLIEVRKTVPYLKKDNAGYQFKYVSSSQTLGAVRDAMDAQGLLLVPRVTKTEVRDHTTERGAHEYFTLMDIEYTWINSDNPEETITCSWHGQGLDNGEKGVGKAQTYAEKYFLLKFFNIATDKDDPDADQRPRAVTPSPPYPPVVPPKPAAPTPAGVTADERGSLAGASSKIMSDDEKKIEIGMMLLGITGNDTEAGDLLADISGFEGKNGPVPGVRDVSQIKTAKNPKSGKSALDVTYLKVRERYNQGNKEVSHSNHCIQE